MAGNTNRIGDEINVNMSVAVPQYHGKVTRVYQDHTGTTWYCYDWEAPDGRIIPNEAREDFVSRRVYR